MKWLAFWLLQFAEWFYLRAHGWRSLGRDEWAPPESYRWKRSRPYPHRQGHAVNAMKLLTHRGKVR